jgi:mRNA interferase HigB
MRIIAIATLRKFWKKHPKSEEPLKSWHQEVRYANWNKASELKEKYRNASILTSKRVVFNIKGNNYRLIVDIEYKLKIVFIVWIGTHEAYDKIDAKTINYDKANKK